MVKIDATDREIIRELVRYPRSTDSAISKKTGHNVMTVNRRRKKLEEGNILRYYTSIDKSPEGVEVFTARELFIIQFRIGISKQEYRSKLEADAKWRTLNSEYISFAYLGEKEGHLSLVIALDAPSQKEMVEEFNGKIVPYIKGKLGDNCIRHVQTVALTDHLRVHHNYLPHKNVDNARIVKDWPDDQIFVDGR